MSEGFDLREEELQFVSQPYLFEPQEKSKFTILLRHKSVGCSFGTSRVVQYVYSRPPEASYLNL